MHFNFFEKMKRMRSLTTDEDNPLIEGKGVRRRTYTPYAPKNAYKELEKIIDYTKASGKQTLQRRLAGIFENPKVEFFLNSLNGVISIVLVLEYIYMTYSLDVFDNLIWGTISFIFHLYLLMDFILRLYAAKYPKKFVLSLNGIVDIISNVPFIIVRLSLGNPFLAHTYNLVMRLADLFTLLRILKLEVYQRFIENEVNKQLVNILLTILTLILFTAGLLQILQYAQVQASSNPSYLMIELSHRDYHQFIFNIIVTISTLGFDNPFTTAISKIFLIVLVITSIFIIPAKSSQLVNILSSKSAYARVRYKTAEQTAHIIITGTVTDIAAYDFLHEFFHEDHGSQPRHGIILAPTIPDSIMESTVLKNPEFQSNVIYIQGNPLIESDLKRCQVEKAKAIIILCNKHSRDPNEEDARTILQAMFIKKYLKQFKANVKLCMQILRPEGKTHYYLSLNRQTRADQVLCVEELKLSLLAKSCLCPGLVTLISNLILSAGEPPKRTELDNEWLDEYFHGKTFEVYRVSLSNAFVGKKFSWVAAKIYKKFRAILFALELGIGDSTKIYPNPGDYILTKSSKITGYVISEDKEIADAISNYQITPEEAEAKKRAGTSFGGTKSFTKAFGTSVTTERTISMFFDEKNEWEDEEEEDLEFAAKIRQDNFVNSLSGEYLNLEEGFHIAPSKISLTDVTFKTMENNILANNHIILCGIVPNLKNFILPLRAKYLEHYPPIVILHTAPPSDKQWNQISYFPEIYYVKGSAMNTRDLLRANIMHASRIVILAPEVEEVKNFVSFNDINQSQRHQAKHSKKLTRDQEDLLDAKTIFKYKAIMKLKPDIPVVTELVCPQNLGFLIGNAKDYATMKKYGIMQTPTFAAGAIYLSSMIDSLVCQAYYNSSLITVLNQLIVGIGGAKQKGGDPLHNISASNLYHFEVPKAFVGQNFDSLFEYLTKNQNIVPLGLYRMPGVKGNKSPYVVTNPEPETILTEKDIVFILSQTSPPETSTEWGAPFEAEPEKNNHFNAKKASAKEKEVMINYEEVDKENAKNKLLNIESEITMGKILTIVSKLKKQKDDIDQLKAVLTKRPVGILESIHRAIHSQILELLPESENNIHIRFHNEEDVDNTQNSSMSTINNSKL